jgi:hypothetical protein
MVKRRSEVSLQRYDESLTAEGQRKRGRSDEQIHWPKETSLSKDTNFFFILAQNFVESAFLGSGVLHQRSESSFHLEGEEIPLHLLSSSVQC